MTYSTSLAVLILRARLKGSNAASSSSSSREATSSFGDVHEYRSQISSRCAPIFVLRTAVDLSSPLGDSSRPTDRPTGLRSGACRQDTASHPSVRPSVRSSIRSSSQASLDRASFFRGWPPGRPPGRATIEIALAWCVWSCLRGIRRSVPCPPPVRAVDQGGVV